MDQAGVDILQAGVLQGDRAALGRAVTLIESTKPSHRQWAYSLINGVLNKTGNSVRIGITGSPGAGKSTFIDVFGNYLTEQGYQVAVLAVDPSSGVSGGSILGDKTRMRRLLVNSNAFVRPSPASGELGGIARNTYEAMLLCEAAGYNIILIETVGVGQSETMVKEMTDMVLFLTMPGAGDELQGIKRGIMEAVNVVVINKCDLFERRRISELKESLRYALHLFSSQIEVPVLNVSSETGDGISDVWRAAENYLDSIRKISFFEKNRNQQRVFWMKRTLEQMIFDKISANESYTSALKKYEESVLSNEISPAEAAARILEEVKLETGIR